MAVVALVLTYKNPLHTIVQARSSARAHHLEPRRHAAGAGRGGPRGGRPRGAAQRRRRRGTAVDARGPGIGRCGRRRRERGRGQRRPEDVGGRRAGPTRVGCGRGRARDRHGAGVGDRARGRAPSRRRVAVVAPWPRLRAPGCAERAVGGLRHVVLVAVVELLPHHRRRSPPSSAVWAAPRWASGRAVRGRSPPRTRPSRASGPTRTWLTACTSSRCTSPCSRRRTTCRGRRSAVRSSPRPAPGGPVLPPDHHRRRGAGLRRGLPPAAARHPGPRRRHLGAADRRRGALPRAGGRPRHAAAPAGIGRAARRRRRGHRGARHPSRRGVVAPRHPLPGLGVLRLRVTALPGWHATVDGKPTALATWSEGAMLQLHVPGAATSSSWRTGPTSSPTASCSPARWWWGWPVPPHGACDADGTPPRPRVSLRRTGAPHTPAHTEADRPSHSR